jgi:hypothetical protein
MICIKSANGRFFLHDKEIICIKDEVRNCTVWFLKIELTFY